MTISLDTLKKNEALQRMETLRQSDRRDASVLMPLIEKEDGLHVLFQVRSNDISQGGEISFPGGGRDHHERGSETAIRETVEELLVKPEQVEVVAPLYRLIGPGGRIIRSYLGVIHDYEDTYSKSEVARIFTVPLSFFLENKPLISTVEYAPELAEDFPYHLLPGGREYEWHHTKRNVYFYQYENEVIWGMTAEILYHAVLKIRNS